MDRNSIDLKGARILLVDDMPANLDVLFELLQAEDFEISMAPGGEIALKIVREAEALPDLILLDVMMPGMDGFEVCRRLKGDPRTREIPVVFITALDQMESVVEGFEIGGVDYIPKPFRHQEVLVRVRNALLTKRLFDQNRAYQEKMEQELQTAHDLQMGLMPDEAPELRGFSVAGRCVPAEQVGGDFFQYFELDGGELALCLADATGHAMAAAIPAVLFSGMLATQMETGTPADDLFPRLNQSVRGSLDPRSLICFAMARIDPGNRRLRLRNAGCPYPFHYRAREGRVVELQDGQAYPLGAGARGEYPEMTVQLEPGDRVVFCSDGIVEAENGREERFGFERTEEAIRRGCERGLGSEGLLEELLGAVRTFAGEAPQEDDQTVVVLEVEG